MSFDNFFDRSQNSLGSVLSNKAGDAIRSIDNPILRNAAGNLLNRALPGFGGGVPDYTDNAYGAIIAEKIAQSVAETQGVVAAPFTTSIDASGTANNPNATSTELSKKYDWRARLRPKKGGEETFYAAQIEGQDGDSGFEDYLMRPIQESNGLVWQNTPTVFLTGTADYDQKYMQGMQYPINTYFHSRAPEIPVTADFTANNIYEARYLLAVMVFLRIATKGFYGDSAVANARYGTPPPVMIFEYLGDHGFNKVPVVVNNYQLQLDNQVDYVPVEVQGTITYVPTMANVIVNLVPQYTPTKLRRRFDLQAVANGALYKDGFI
jgi:hypothetical protein